MAIENVDAIDERRSNTVRNRLFGLQFVCLTGDKWKILAICDPRSSIVQSLLDCRLSEYLMIIEYFGHFSIKHIVGNPNRKKMHIFGFVGIFEYIC